MSTLDTPRPPTAPACTNCGYDLRDLRGNTCPECGATLVFVVDDPIRLPRLRIAVLALVLAAIIEGLRAVVGIYGFISMWGFSMQGTAMTGYYWLIPTFVQTLLTAAVCGLAVYYIVLIARRRTDSRQRTADSLRYATIILLFIGLQTIASTALSILVMLFI